jgi:iron complex outermembrane receptor protein
MNDFLPRRARSGAIHSESAQSRALTATASAVLMLFAASAQAQQAPSTGAQTVTVTGIRKGIESAISVKKDADGVVEAISAEDIGKLPDTTIAESLARLPGVTTQRDRNGNATNISIRGLGPDFNGYLLNGREQTSTGDSRAVDLSVYPAELIAGATVYKTSDASLMAAGLAGTIDNKLVDPLAFGSRVFAVSAQDVKTAQGLPDPGTGKRFSLTYIDQFADRRLGVAIGYVHSSGTSSSLVNGSWGSSGISATLANGSVVTGVSVPFGGGLGFETDRNTDKRDGVAAIVAFKPNKDFTSQVDLYYADINTALKKTAIKAGTNGSNITNATVVGGVAQTGTYAIPANGLIGYNENIFDHDKIESLGWKNSLKFADGWSGSLDLNHNKATRVEKDIEAYGFITTPGTLTFNSAGSTPQLTLSNPAAYTDPTQIAIHDKSGWSGVNYATGPFAGQQVPQAGYFKGPTITDKLDALRLDFRRDLPEGSMFTDIQFGGNFTKRTKDRLSDEGLIVSANNGGYDRIAYPADAYVQNNVGGTGVNLLTFDPQVGLWPGAVLLRKYNDDILSKSWTVDEKVLTAYAKANIDTKLAGIPVRGNVGAQIVNTDQSSAGFRAGVSSSVTLTNPASGLTRNGTQYTDVLPSLNLSGDLGGGQIVRLGLAEQIARPTMTDMRNSFAAAVDVTSACKPVLPSTVCTTTLGQFVGSAGNPNLKPFKAAALDLSFEKYFGNKGYLSAAGFYKKLDTYITPATATHFDFTTYANQLGLTIPAGGPFGTYTTTVNGSGGNLSGVELTASVPFNLVFSALEGFGLTTSYSSTASTVSMPNLLGLNPNQQVPSGSTRITLPGLSKTNAKLIMYYERGGFSAFVADNYRSTYIGSVSGAAVGGYPSLTYIEGSSWVSAQVGYEVQDGVLKGLGLRFEGNNLNKPNYREFGGANPTSNKTGASYAFRLNYKLQ